jgi:hypothetical protein
VQFDPGQVPPASAVLVTVNVVALAETAASIAPMQPSINKVRIVIDSVRLRSLMSVWKRL